MEKEEFEEEFKKQKSGGHVLIQYGGSTWFYADKYVFEKKGYVKLYYNGENMGTYSIKRMMILKPFISRARKK